MPAITRMYVQRAISSQQCCSRDLSETFHRDLSTFEIVRYIKIPTTEAIESNDLNIENWYFVDN